MFPVTVTIHNNDQLAAVLHALGNFFPTTAVTEGTPPKPKKAAHDKKEEPAATPSTAEASAAHEQKAETSDAKPGSGKTVDDAKALTMKIVADKGRDAAVALLKKYDVPVAAKLPADKIDAFCADAEKVLAS